ncbi:unnamed protein product [Malus baccata var. baccata]
MGNIKVSKAKPNVYSIEGNLWFIKCVPFTLKFWHLYQSLDEICANIPVFWIQVHEIPRNSCTTNNARMLNANMVRFLRWKTQPLLGSGAFFASRLILMLLNPSLPIFRCPALTVGLLLHLQTLGSYPKLQLEGFYKKGRCKQV